MNFWWYIKWSKEILERTFKCVKDNKNGKIISTNVLEYATGLINHAEAYHCFLTHPDPNEP